MKVTNWCWHWYVDGLAVMLTIFFQQYFKCPELTQPKSDESANKLKQIKNVLLGINWPKYKSKLAYIVLSHRFTDLGCAKYVTNVSGTNEMFAQIWKCDLSSDLPTYWPGWVLKMLTHRFMKQPYVAAGSIIALYC